MLKKIILIGIMASVVSTPALAEGTSKERVSGLGAGVIIGAFAGGPIGAMVAGALGAKLGDEFHERNDKVDTLTASLNGSTSQINSLQSDVESLNVEIQSINNDLRQARAMAKPEVLALLEAGIEMDLLFRTDEYVLADSTGGRLGQLAATVAADPDIQVRLDGFADERGDEAYNQELSVRRVEYVRDVLVGSGIPASRISLNAHGEATAIDASADSYALERRVSLTLYMGDTPSFAANPR